MKNEFHFIHGDDNLPKFNIVILQHFSISFQRNKVCVHGESDFCMYSMHVFISFCSEFVDKTLTFQLQKTQLKRWIKMNFLWEFAQDAITSQLKVDQALLNISSTLYQSVWLYQLSDECVAVRII